jgi:LuxR family maltose regulon positive regulatory protein
MLTDPAALDALSYVLRNARAGLHLLVAARMDPVLPLHRYRLNGELTEIRAADLAFSVAEARTLMAQHGVTLPPESLEALVRKDEGWAAGLRLAAMSMERHPEPARLAAEFGARQSAVTAYFVREVLNAQPPDVRNVLLKSSILDRVTPALVGELVGDGHAEAVIPRLAEANAFVQPIGGDWYRYHPLFAEVLRLKLRHERPDDVPRLNQRAAAWLRRNGMLVEAVKHLTAVGQWRLASRMAVEDLAVGRLIDPRGCTTLAEAFREMPTAGESADPPILVVTAAMRLRDLDEQACAAWLRRAERALARLPSDQELPSRLAVSLMHADMARRSGDIRAVKAAVAETGGVLVRIPDDMLSRRSPARAQLAFLRGAVELWAGHLDAATEILDEATAAVAGAHACADCAEYWALLEAIRGRRELAYGLVRPATGAPLPPTAGALCASPDGLATAVTGLVTARHGLATGHASAAEPAARSVRQSALEDVPLEEQLIGAVLGFRGGKPAAGQKALQRGQRLEPARTGLTGMDDELPPIKSDQPAPVIVEELSDREQEVLRYVSGMLSTSEVAEEMYISVNTVKSHLKSIFRKLGATRRGEAVRRARQLELI